MKLNAQQLTNTFLQFYAQNKFRPELDQLTEQLLWQVLSARGYLNASNNTVSGEEYFINEVLKPSNPQFCVDVGANVGDYTMDLLENTSAEIVSFEPLPGPFAVLADRASAFSGRVTLENKGVGSADGDAVIHYNEDRTAHASFSEEIKQVPYVTNELKHETKIVSLDSYFSEKSVSRIDLLKIDTEGFEQEVFEGAKTVLSEVRPKFIQLEFNLHQLFRGNTLKYFADQLPGYETYQLLPGRWVKRNPDDPLSNVFQFSNFVFVRST